MIEFLLGPGQVLSLDFAGESDRRRVRKWGQYPNLRTGNPIVRDAVELSEVALARWDEAKSKERDAADVQDIRDRIADEPYAEIGSLLVAKPTWTQDPRLAVLGVCYFHRTWCNNFVIDYLAVHPAVAYRPSKPNKSRRKPIRGVGLALFYYLAKLAVEIRVPAIWGEATQTSSLKYRVWFGKPEMTDLIYLAETDFKAFIETVEKKLNSV